MSDDILEMIELGLVLRLVDDGIDQARAERLIDAEIKSIRASYGGSRWFIRRGYRLCSPEQQAQICAEFTGSNAAEVTERYGISRATLYRYLNK